jgi:hypothetical protein
VPSNTSIHSTHQRVTGGSEGESATYKKDGYASGPVPKSMRVSKVGADPQTPYSGPNVARQGS